MVKLLKKCKKSKTMKAQHENRNITNSYHRSKESDTSKKLWWDLHANTFYNIKLSTLTRLF